MIGKLPAYSFCLTLAMACLLMPSDWAGASGGVQLALEGADTYDFNGTRRIDISGNTVLVGGCYWNSGGGTVQNWAQAFVHGDGQWQHQQTLSVSSPTNFFGYGVGIDGDMAVVGDYGNNEAYLFERSGGVWQQSSGSTLQYPGATNFGYDTRIDDDRVIVGTCLGNSAFIFTSEDGWDEGECPLIGSGYFGHSVDISGTHAVVGDYWNNTAGLYQLDGDAWTLESTVSHTGSNQFGYSVAIDGNYAIVGDNTAGVGGQSYVGSASIYCRQENGAWEEQITLHPLELMAGDRFGSSVAISGNTAVVGAINQGPLGQRTGSAYVFQRVDSIWKQVGKVRPTDGIASDDFGCAVAIDGDWIAVGAWSHDSSGGAVYVYDTPSLTMIPGDANLDGEVDDNDAITLASHWGLAAGWTGGDFDGDGLVGPADASIMAAHWHYEMPDSAPSSSVPEPTAVVLLAGMLVLLIARRRR
ncbi:MAG: PEP-CTERM sorting domain-containing protein [Pirellulales bacterium]|nr:PEP-CTERM sorting domain-containing protein [Pirellulales bacterium]